MALELVAACLGRKPETVRNALTRFDLAGALDGDMLDLSPMCELFGGYQWLAYLKQTASTGGKVRADQAERDEAGRFVARDLRQEVLDALAIRYRRRMELVTDLRARKASLYHCVRQLLADGAIFELGDGRLAIAGVSVEPGSAEPRNRPRNRPRNPARSSAPALAPAPTLAPAPAERASRARAPARPTGIHRPAPRKSRRNPTRPVPVRQSRAIPPPSPVRGPTVTRCCSSNGTPPAETIAVRTGEVPDSSPGTIASAKHSITPNWPDAPTTTSATAWPCCTPSAPSERTSARTTHGAGTGKPGYRASCPRPVTSPTKPPPAIAPARALASPRNPRPPGWRK